MNQGLSNEHVIQILIIYKLKTLRCCSFYCQEKDRRRAKWRTIKDSSFPCTVNSKEHSAFFHINILHCICSACVTTTTMNLDSTACTRGRNTMPISVYGQRSKYVSTFELEVCMRVCVLLTLPLHPYKSLVNMKNITFLFNHIYFSAHRSIL